MRSPFPGMDPWLEARWSDVHPALIVAIRSALQPLLPPDLRARAEERVLLESGEGEELATYRPDVTVVGAQRSPAPESVGEGRSSLGPVMIEVPTEPRIERWVKIVDVRDGHRVITAIEVLSPGNKRPGLLNTAYRRKVYEYVRGGVNLVEIDLLREPRTRLEVGQRDLPADRQAAYLTCLRRASAPARWEVWPMALREPLASIPIPLREGEADIGLPLQPLLDEVYAGGGHDDIDYRRPPDPPLKGPDTEWADGILRASGRR